MRPPEFTGGNGRGPRAATAHRLPGFNEAAGIHRRKLYQKKNHDYKKHISFNEAAGIHRRKQVEAGAIAGMRNLASMRPPEFTGGNAPVIGHRNAPRVDASMRPPEFTGGNTYSGIGATCTSSRFNEAAGIHRRKPLPR